MPQESVEVLLETVRVRLEALTTMVDTGFKTQDGRLNRLESDVAEFREWKAARIAVESSQGSIKDWHLKLVLGFIAVCSLATTIVSFVFH